MGDENVFWRRVSAWYLDAHEGKSERFLRQLYALTRTPHNGGRVFLGLASVIELPKGGDRPAGRQHPPRRRTPAKLAHDVIQPYLVTSRDGIRWDLGWIDRRRPLVPLGKPGAFDHGIVFPASRIVAGGGRHWVFYEGRAVPHERRHDGYASFAGIGLATLDRDRIVRVRPASAWGEWGVLTTTAFRLGADVGRILVNVEFGNGGEQAAIAAAGECRVAVVLLSTKGRNDDREEDPTAAAATEEAPGFTFCDAISLTAASPPAEHASSAPYPLFEARWSDRGLSMLAHRARAKPAGDRGEAGRATWVRLRFYLRGQASVYGFSTHKDEEIVDGLDGDGDGFFFL